MKDGHEVEAKFRITPAQREAISRRLADRVVLRCTQEDTYFEAGDRVLRLRHEDERPAEAPGGMRAEGGSWVLTAKGASSVNADGVKVRTEVEFPLDAATAERLAWLFPWLGHRQLITVRKERIEHDLDGATVALDTLSGLSDAFAEIEVLGGPDAASRVEAVRAELGLSPNQIETKSYARLVAEAAANRPDPGG